MLLRYLIDLPFPLFKLITRAKTVSAILCLILFSSGVRADLPVQLVSVYQSNIQVDDYLVSEKFDGVRAIWREGKLVTKNGNPIHAPTWFLEALPDVWLDGELWSKRQDFEFAASTVLSKKINQEAWKKITYNVFDMPDYQLPFEARAKAYTTLLNELNVNFIKPIKQVSLKGNDALSDMLKDYTKRGAEGLILHRKQARFASGRSDNVLKLKPYQESQARVKAYVPGNGKYQGQTGALEVVWRENHDSPVIRFKIGSGLSDKERLAPPALGSLIRFKYHGLTKNKIPRFASYIGLARPQ